MSYEYRTVTAKLVDERIRKMAEIFVASDLQIELQRDIHLNRYQRRLDYAKNNPNQHIINVTETTKLHNLWENMKGKRWSDLSKEEKDEILDALVSSGYFD